jgi:hypothetical protein
MAKLLSPFTEVTCPICGSQIDCKPDKAALVRHIKNKHPTASVRELVGVLFHELNLSMPQNIDKISGKELDELLTDLCLYKATKLGQKKLRRKIRGR